MKKAKMINDVASAIILAAIPALVSNLLLQMISTTFYENHKFLTNTISYLVCVVFGVAVLYFLDALLSRIKTCRFYSKYEGIWIEKIPGFERDMSICRLYYDDGEYHFIGTNFGDKETITFESVAIVEYKARELFYVTKPKGRDNYEGLGKIDFCAISPGSHNTIIKAAGYFMDSKNPDIDKTGLATNDHDTKMVKIDDAFCKEYLQDLDASAINRMSDEAIYKRIKEILMNGITIEELR